MTNQNQNQQQQPAAAESVTTPPGIEWKPIDEPKPGSSEEPQYWEAAVGVWSSAWEDGRGVIMLYVNRDADTGGWMAEVGFSSRTNYVRLDGKGSYERGEWPTVFRLKADAQRAAEGYGLILLRRAATELERYLVAAKQQAQAGQYKEARGVLQWKDGDPTAEQDINRLRGAS